MPCYVDDGDLLPVKSPDRLSWLTMDTLRISRPVASALSVYPSTLSTVTQQGELTFTILVAVSQLQPSTIRERQAERISLATA